MRRLLCLYSNRPLRELSGLKRKQIMDEARKNRDYSKGPVWDLVRLCHIIGFPKESASDLN